VFNTDLSLSCLGFPGSCKTPTALATTGGDLVLGAAGELFGTVDVGEFTATTSSVTPSVPEPGTWALMAAGLVAFGLKRRKWVVLRAA
jgi:hypothetical protein